MATYLTKIKWTTGSNAGQYGYQETPRAGSNTLLHLYDENGEQLDNGRSFPNAQWESLPYSSHLEDQDDFWDAIESLRFAR